MIHVLQLFIVDTLLFSVLDNIYAIASKLDNDLVKIQDLACKRKVYFNHDRTKQVQEVIFSRKKFKNCHPNVCFNQ